MNERIKSLEGRVRRVQNIMKTNPLVIKSSKATSSVNSSIHQEDNNSS